ncbi:MAG: aminoacyl-tRNA hydrolase [Dehalococcoidia bacterium]|nr:aminoacyl-tRNA hydrolase [Dehalococcoidia bacterium]
MRLLIGLGNPGSRYARNRHNVGFQCIDQLARFKGIKLDKRSGYALVGELDIDGSKVLLAKPQTFMNKSGDSVASLKRELKASPEEVLVIYDDMDLPLGRIRVRAEGSSGGQRGMQSIIERLGTKSFPRIRVGVGRPLGERFSRYEEDIIDWLISDFTTDEEATMVGAREQAGEAALAVVKDGIEKAMNRYNNR